VIMPDLVIYNSKKIKGNVAVIPDYLLSNAISNNKKIKICHLNKKVKTIKNSEIKQRILFVRHKSYDGMFLGEKISYKIVGLYIA
jgi:hypothetical protein